MNESTNIGNPDEKSVSDTPQVIDDSSQTGFGNEGDSGHDSPSPGNESQKINNDGSKKIASSDVVSNETELTASSEKSMVIEENTNFFTLGSPKEKVIDVMGTPTSIIGNSWGYDYSSVQLNSSSEEVIGWSNISENLNVFMGPRIKTAAPFTKGSSKQQVLHAMGTPTSVIRDSWGYGFSTVQFDLNGKVTSWSNMDNNLKVTMNSK